MKKKKKSSSSSLRHAHHGHNDRLQALFWFITFICISSSLDFFFFPSSPPLSFFVSGFIPRERVIRDPLTVSRWHALQSLIRESRQSRIEDFLKGELLINQTGSRQSIISPLCHQTLTSLLITNNNSSSSSSSLLYFNRMTSSWSSTSSLPSSFLSGVTFDPGSRAACLWLPGTRHIIIKASLAAPEPESQQIFSSLSLDTSTFPSLDSDPHFRFFGRSIAYFIARKPETGLYFGICVPEKCSNQDVNAGLRSWIRRSKRGEEFQDEQEELLNVGLEELHVLEYPSSKSRSRRGERNHDHDSSSTFFIPLLKFSFMVYLLLVLILSLIHERQVLNKSRIQRIEEQEENSWIRFLIRTSIHFDLRTNHRKLMAPYGQEVQSPLDQKNNSKNSSNSRAEHYERMRPLDTVKFVFQIFASAIHIVVLAPSLPLSLPSLKEWRSCLHYSSFGNDVWMQFSWGIQLVFAISGFFTAFITLPIMIKTGAKVPFRFFLLKRYLRTLPSLLFVIGLTLVIPSLFDDSSPSRDSSSLATRTSLEFFRAPCARASSLLKTIFFLNNINEPLDQMCLFQSWFLSADFQLWTLSYLPLIWLTTNPKRGIISIILIMIISCVSSALSLHVFDLPAFPSGREIDILVTATSSRLTSWWYFTPNNNCFCYFSGILTAYYCLKYLEGNNQRNKNSGPLIKQSSPWWIGATISCIALGAAINLFPAFYKNVFFGPPSRTIELIYSFLARISIACYSVILFVVLFSRLHTVAPLKYLVVALNLDAHHFTILARLSFCVFLSHLLSLVLYIHVFEPQFSAYFFPNLLILLSFNLFSFAIGYLIHLFVEAPFASLLSFHSRQFRIPEIPENNNNNSIEMSHHQGEESNDDVIKFQEEEEGAPK